MGCLSAMDLQRIHYAWLLVSLFQITSIAAVTNSKDGAALSALKIDWQNTPKNWVDSDPCGDGWVGIKCSNSRVISITILSSRLKGPFSENIQFLSELQTLDLSSNKNLTGPIPASIGNLKKLTSLTLIGCGFYGQIPDSIGSLQNLTFLALNSNRFNGKIPSSIGKLAKLFWLDLADNELTGPIPISNGTTPGLDMLVNTPHFHLGKNQLSGTIPPQLFSSNMKLIHALFDNNLLTGSLPSTLGLVTALEIIRFDRNLLSGTVPSNLNNLTSVVELHLSNNNLSGPIPDLTGMDVLNYVDLGNNNFDITDAPSWFSTTFGSLTTLLMDKSNLQGAIPAALFSNPQLQTVSLRYNRLNGTLDIGADFSNQLQLIDLQNNSIQAFLDTGVYHNHLILLGNPYCAAKTGAASQYCMQSENQSISSYSTASMNCVPVVCPSDQNASPTCKCSYPYKGTLVFRTISFSDLGRSSYYKDLESSLLHSFGTYQLPVDSVSLSNLRKDSYDYLEISLEIFPSGNNRFSWSEILGIGLMLSNQTFKPPNYFGPFYFITTYYGYFRESSTKSNNSVRLGIIIGAAIGGFLVALVLICAGFYGCRQKRRAERVIKQNIPFASWDPSKSSGSIPQLKGARWFSFEELKKCTCDFSEASEIGEGGYGKVYKGTISSGHLVAIKRAQHGSLQGGLEFKTEIEMLSRVHHKNLVNLVGFCFEQGEQILVYEYIPNGTLRESLSGKSGIQLDWMKRLQAAVGSARGLTYLHELADPPVIHRDIKSNNILLDERLNAKVSDFGLSKLMNDSEKDHVTTQVKGTMGYLDPEYYMTQQLTEKSDVYSFGVVMLELITARKPIERGTNYIVRQVRVAMDKTKDLYGLHDFIDPNINGSGHTLKGFENFVDLALNCVEDSAANRPTMSQVVKEIERIMQLAGLNPNAESSPSTSGTYDVGKSRSGKPHLPYSNEFCDYSGDFLPSKVEPQ
ncbi:leucine-rich repeat receptor protein kinase HPCA1-like [Macadamia integrifolia]|uniref:leucine-rich repeat receptor protein kinase HPCA1-like n=1 Tax=Macadamia integrifolia TaxID=60698 RepID=UPI001C4F1452|nr:leucine-rich repeat receptor protein kinase HPCA1-like [Macadamia integrifolia]